MAKERTKLGKPLEHCVVTQPYGVNYIYKGFYKKLGIPSDMHNGIDFRLTDDRKIFSMADGDVTKAIFHAVAGNIISIKTQAETDFKIRYLHLEKMLVDVDDKVKKGDLIGIGGNTGIGSKGPHLHADRRFYNENGMVIDYHNDYHGMTDFMPDLEDGWAKLPIDFKYGKTKNEKIEHAIRFGGVPWWWTKDEFLKLQIEKGQWIHRQLIAIGRHPSSFTVREMNAIIYGSWGFYEAIEPSMINLTYFLTRSEYKSGKQPPITLNMG